MTFYDVLKPGVHDIHVKSKEQTSEAKIPLDLIRKTFYSFSCPKELYHLESDNLFRITLVVADWLG